MSIHSFETPYSVSALPQPLVHPPARVPQWVLRGTDTQVCLDLGPVLLGRDHSCTLPLSSATTSRFHCLLHRVGEQAFVRDLHSTNGVLLNGQQVVQQAPLQAGDQLEVGGSVFQITLGSPCVQRPHTQGVILQLKLETPGDGGPERHPALSAQIADLLDRLEDRVLWHFGHILQRQARGLSCVFGLWPHANPHYDAAAEALDTALAALDELQLRDFPEFRPQLGLVAGSLSADTLALANQVADSNRFYATSLLMNGPFFQQLEQQKGGREVDCVRFSPQAQPVSLYTWDERLLRSRQFLFSGWYQMGLAAYRQGQWPEAERLFGQGAEAGDTLSALMLRRLQILKTQAPVNWDGIWELGGAFTKP